MTTWLIKTTLVGGLKDAVLSGTILGTSRDKPHRMPVGGKVLGMTDVIVGNYHANHLDALVCPGGGGTQKNALRLKEHGGKYGGLSRVGKSAQSVSFNHFELLMPLLS